MLIKSGWLFGWNSQGIVLEEAGVSTSANHICLYCIQSLLKCVWFGEKFHKMSITRVCLLASSSHQSNDLPVYHPHTTIILAETKSKRIGRGQWDVKSYVTFSEWPDLLKPYFHLFSCCTKQMNCSQCWPVFGFCKFTYIYFWDQGFHFFFLFLFFIFSTANALASLLLLALNQMELAYSLEMHYK